jgi:hypothetical protein
MLQITHDNFFLQHTYVSIALYILELPSSWSTSWIRPSWPQSRVELRLLLFCLMSILLVCLGPPSILLFTPTTQISLSPFLTSLTAQHRCTSKQHGYATSYVHIHTYLHHIHITVHFLLYTSSTFFCRPAGSDSSRLTQIVLVFFRPTQTMHLWKVHTAIFKLHGTGAIAIVPLTHSAPGRIRV